MTISIRGVYYCDMNHDGLDGLRALFSPLASRPARPQGKRGRKVTVYFKGSAHELLASDTQRSKVYKAERAALAQLDQRKYPTVKDLERRVREIMGSATARKIRDEFGLRRKTQVSVGDGRGRRAASSYGGEIRMPRWARTDWVLLHELAHELAPRSVHHHWPFAHAYLKLVSRFMGTEAAEAAKALKASFREHKVRFAPKRKRNLTEEQRQELRDRLAKARAAR